jgi:hypothetical protein
MSERTVDLPDPARLARMLRDELAKGVQRLEGLALESPPDSLSGVLEQWREVNVFLEDTHNLLQKASLTALAALKETEKAVTESTKGDEQE